ncbi:MAG: DUF615 domain-containing protein [Betaproteobacteria bacterium]|nr:DUF615 domain-containing protein [Betaproteobacteria bacterium]
MDRENPVSKTRRKREMTALQDLGQELVQLNVDRLAALDLPDALLRAIHEARSIKSFPALRRQLQYIGRLMRDVDAAPIRARLEAWQVSSRHHTVWLHRVERWRDRLLAEDAALEEFIAENPGADPQPIRTLIRNARAERIAGKPPKNYRALFQALAEIIPPSPPEPPARRDEQ